MIVSHSPWKFPANFERLGRMSDGSSDFRQFRLISESYVWFRIAPFDSSAKISDQTIGHVTTCLNQMIVLSHFPS